MDRENIIEGLEKLRTDLGYGLPDRSNTVMEYLNSLTNAIALLKEQEVRELTVDEWREWKNNPKRDPICELWENDTSTMWVMDPDRIHEPALLMGKLKLFTGKPTFEQCKAVKWE